MPCNTEIARKLRRNQTDAEKLIWRHLRGRRLGATKFRRQVPIGSYIADFVCEDARLVVEIDGGQHSENESDAIRTAFLERAGYTVLRLWNNDVTANPDAVLEQIVEMLKISGKRIDA